MFILFIVQGFCDRMKKSYLQNQANQKILGYLQNI